MEFVFRVKWVITRVALVQDRVCSVQAPSSPGTRELQAPVTVMWVGWDAGLLWRADKYKYLQRRQKTLHVSDGCLT